MTRPYQDRFHDALHRLGETHAGEGKAARITALRTLVALFLEATRHETASLPAHFAEITSALLARVPLSVRAEVARCVAHSDALPGEIVRRLAADAPEVAGSVLRQNPRLAPAGLLRIARGPCPRKALAIAGRRDLTPEVVDALIARGEGEIGAALAESRALSADQAARIALSGTLPRHAADQLAAMPDLDPDALAALFWSVAPGRRQALIDRLIDHHRHAPDRAEPPLALDREVVRIAARRRRVDLAARLAAGLDLTPALASRIVDDPGGEALVVAGRAGALPVDAVTGIVLLTSPEAGTAYQALRALVDLAARLDPAVARRLVAQWRRLEASPAIRVQREPAVAAPGRAAARPARQAPRTAEGSHIRFDRPQRRDKG